MHPQCRGGAVAGRGGRGRGEGEEECFGLFAQGKCGVVRFDGVGRE